jgi:hypothetical protein
VDVITPVSLIYTSCKLSVKIKNPFLPDFSQIELAFFLLPAGSYTHLLKL